MAEGKKPAVLTIAGVIELVFSILIFIFAIVLMVMGCGSSVTGMVGSAGGGAMTEDAVTAAAAGAGVMMIVTIVLSLAAIAMGIIGIIAATKLFKGSKSGRSLSNFWAIALMVIFLIGLIPAVISMANAGGMATGLQNLTEAAGEAADVESLGDLSITTTDFQAVGTGMGVVNIVLSFIAYFLPAIIVFILLKLKPVKDYFAAQA